MTVILFIALLLPGQEEPVTYQERMASLAECTSTVWEMANRAPAELKSGGKLQVGCAVTVPKSENP